MKWKNVLKIVGSAVLSGAATSLAAKLGDGETKGLWIVAAAGAASGVANLLMHPPKADPPANNGQ
jgi:hypothetical protein